MLCLEICMSNDMFKNMMEMYCTHMPLPINEICTLTSSRHSAIFIEDYLLDDTLFKEMCAFLPYRHGIIIACEACVK